ncbi:sulfite exporter TauE/SafE family protein [Poseidonibacter lekithochrous]|uniref:sulfite exporter TauE/SafE family protein n=1 Tax=Poseidonibacter lekithochrous TaxID=1904463 RepID=UPI0008FCA375|nr:TSUP family transporter [Poseidonibacter lekithochrous]QKJ22202.1 sulfite exporter TauE/SafE family protein [Poseidonibacter lekithochrous]
MEFLENITTSWIIIFILTGFIAGYIDSIAGGGGMIQVPVLLYSGIPPIFVLATNKMASLFGTLMATIKYYLSNKISLKVVSIAIIPCLLASYIGSELVMYVPDNIIQWAILISIPIALIFLLKKSKEFKEEKTELSKKNIVLATAPIGFYDGLLGPGTGTYMTISMKKFLHLDYIISTASTKPLNLATNIGSAIAFMMAGKVLWMIAIPMAISNMLGSYVGSHYAIKGGEAFIKKVLIFVLVFMLGANILKIIFT